MRYYPRLIVEHLVEKHRALSDGTSDEEAQRLMEEISSDGHMHGTDHCFWALRVPSLTAPQKDVAATWSDAIDEDFAILGREGKLTRPLNQAHPERPDDRMASRCEVGSAQGYRQSAA